MQWLSLSGLLGRIGPSIVVSGSDPRSLTLPESLQALPELAWPQVDFELIRVEQMCIPLPQPTLSPIQREAEPLINSPLITRALSVHVRGQSTGYRIPKSLYTMQTIVRHVVSDQISDRLWSRLRQLNRVLSVSTQTRLRSLLETQQLPRGVFGCETRPIY